MGDFEGKAKELIPAQVRMISGCQDSQTSADVSNVATFQLPDPNGRAGKTFGLEQLLLFIVATTAFTLRITHHGFLSSIACFLP